MRHVVPISALSLALAISLSACTQPGTGAEQTPVPVMADYDQSFDAIAFSGTLRRYEECIVLIGSDGTWYVPVFRTTADATELARRFDLAGGERVTVNGMNRFPSDGPAAEGFRPWAKCGSHFFTYGGIDREWSKPPRPVNAPEG